MIQDYQEQRERQNARTRALMDLVMGVIVLGMGIVFLVYEQMGWKIFRGKPSALDKIAGVLFVLYGIWRLYRGYKKTKINNNGTR
jgi:uncharacterized membrane protein YdcZ (DUF606 family)